MSINCRGEFPFRTLHACLTENESTERFAEVISSTHTVASPLRKSREGSRTFGNFLRLPEDSQDVTAKDLVDGLSFVASIEEFLGDPGVG